MSTNKETAVDYLYKIIQMGHHIGKADWDKAKQMEKEQIQQCWDTAHQAGRFEGKGIAEENWQTFEQYYNETYKNK